ncbi:hypothetical protein TNIN_205941 [Trichonephila inaurata madagascariensis]|uniref:Uncharacterized protein n=1 Tax=Trichonephila inaurata madagascariensis TaxID=2747483 RepID=A0A8X6X2X6_9ARAC|nr:hypothetical protein TNIN_205941 [Trichonephila inaurata madagascariensis]
MSATDDMESDPPDKSNDSHTGPLPQLDDETKAMYERISEKNPRTPEDLEFSIKDGKNGMLNWSSSQNPDLSPVEHLWEELERGLRGRPQRLKVSDYVRNRDFAKAHKWIIS